MRFPALHAVLVAVALLFAAATVRAQDPPEEESPEATEERLRDRPFQGLFGGDPRRDRSRTVDLSGSLFGGYDDNILADQGTGFPGDVRAGAASIVYGGNATLSYARRWERASLNAFGSSAFSGYPDVDSEIRAAHTAGVGFTKPLSRSSTLLGSQTLSLLPYYQLGDLFPRLPSLATVDVPVATPGFEFSLVKAQALRSASDVRFDRRVSRYGELSFLYQRMSTSYLEGEQDLFDTVDQRIGGRYTHQVGRYVGVRAGYAYRTGRFGFLGEEAAPFRSHDLDVGANYARAFSFWRRTRFSFATGSTVIVTDPVSEVGPQDSDTRFFLTGNASLVREFLRSWAARLTYQRGVNYVDGFTAPLLSDAVAASLGGLLARRVEASTSWAMSRGSVGLVSSDGDAYVTWTARGMLRVAASRRASAYVQYVFYHYDFGSGVVLPPGVARDLDRSSVRAGVSVWLPLL